MKTKHYIYAAALLSACALATPALNADTLAQWNFASNLSATTEATGITGSDISFGSFSSASSSYYGRSGGSADLYSRAFELTQTNGDGRILGTTEAVAANTRNTYFQFTFTPTSGSFDLTNFTANIKAQIAAGTTDLVGFTAYYFLRSDADGYTANLGTSSVSVSGVTSGNGDISDTVSFDADLSSFTNISSAVTFRLYVYAVGEGDVSLAPNHIVRADDFTIVGATSIPEPKQAAALFGGISLLILTIARRRTKR